MVKTAISDTASYCDSLLGINLFPLAVKWVFHVKVDLLGEAV